MKHFQKRQRTSRRRAKNQSPNPAAAQSGPGASFKRLQKSISICALSFTKYLLDLENINVLTDKLDSHGIENVMKRNLIFSIFET